MPYNDPAIIDQSSETSSAANLLNKYNQRLTIGDEVLSHLNTLQDKFVTAKAADYLFVDSDLGDILNVVNQLDQSYSRLRSNIQDFLKYVKYDFVAAISRDITKLQSRVHKKVACLQPQDYATIQAGGEIWPEITFTEQNTVDLIETILPGQQNIHATLTESVAQFAQDVKNLYNFAAHCEQYSQEDQADIDGFRSILQWMRNRESYILDNRAKNFVRMLQLTSRLEEIVQYKNNQAFDVYKAAAACTTKLMLFYDVLVKFEKISQAF